MKSYMLGAPVNFGITEHRLAMVVSRESRGVSLGRHG